MTIIVRNMISKQAGMALRQVAEILYLEPQAQGTDRDTGSGIHFWNLEPVPSGKPPQEDHTANPSQKAPATGIQLLKYELLGAILTQTITGAMLVFVY